MDESNDIPLFTSSIAPVTFCHTLGSERQQSAETVQSSFTSSPIKTHDFVVPKVAFAAENIQFLFDNIQYKISQLMQIVIVNITVQNLELQTHLSLNRLTGYSSTVWVK